MEFLVRSLLTVKLEIALFEITLIKIAEFEMKMDLIKSMILLVAVLLAISSMTASANSLTVSSLLGPEASEIDMDSKNLIANDNYYH